MIHCLKIEPHYLDSVINKTKKFEVRKNDRNFKIGDRLVLLEYDSNNQKYLKRAITTKITYILKDFEGLKENYVVLGIGNIVNRKLFTFPLGDFEQQCLLENKESGLICDWEYEIYEKDIIVLQDYVDYEKTKIKTELVTEVSCVMFQGFGQKILENIGDNKLLMTVKLLQNNSKGA